MRKDGGIKLPPPDKLANLGKQEQILEKTSLSNKDNQAYELIRTVKCHLAPSKVHGVGVIALRDLVKGEQLYCALTVKPQWYTLTLADLSKHLDKTYPEIKRLILDRWPHVVNGSSFISPNYDARLISFMNHSDTPNYDPATDRALKDIKAGEEVFEDYRVIPNFEKAFPWLTEK